VGIRIISAMDMDSWNKTLPGPAVAEKARLPDITPPTVVKPAEISSSV
jgi:hypothetical protein